MEYTRILDLKATLDRKSAFLLGPRSTGKTFLYQHSLKPARVYDLLDLRTLRKLTFAPETLFEEAQRGDLVVIDEIQKIPELLNEVHRTIEGKKVRFLLTGSSARKLKKSQANLLGGRATSLELMTLCSREIPDFDLKRYLNHGGIPRHYMASPADVESDLEDYCSLYLKEEIKDEALTRDLPAFSRFLDVMALHSGDEMALDGFASDSMIKVSTFRNYLEILKDTLIAFEVTPYLATKKRKAITRSKYFLFDVGITNHLAGRLPIKEKSELFGKTFEHFIALELRAYLSYQKSRHELCYWRSTSQFEVDFIVGSELAVEVKAVDRVQDKHLKGLLALGEEKKIKDLVVVSLEARRRKVGAVEVLPWKTFLDELWAGRFL